MKKQLEFRGIGWEARIRRDCLVVSIGLVLTIILWAASVVLGIFK